jgi:hypothetical protein
MSILTTWPFPSPKPPENSPFWLDSFSFALHCFANVKLSNLVYLFSLPLVLLILQLFSMILPSHSFFLLPHVSSFLPLYSSNLTFVYPSCLSHLSLLIKQFYTLDSLHWLLIPKSPFLFKILSWSIPRILKHACPSQLKDEATSSSPEVKPRWPMKLYLCLGGFPLTLLTTFSTISVCWVVELCVCMMMLDFMTLFELVPWSECWCIVGPISAMTSVT